MARLHLDGETPTAVVIWKKWAQQNEADAAYNLAVIHHHADGVAYDPAEAMRWYRVARNAATRPRNTRSA